MSRVPVIAIGAGHGYNTPGKRVTLKGYADTREWWFNDRITDKVQAKLAPYVCKIVRVDDTTGAKDVALATRVKMVNDAMADMYVEVHHNAGVNGGAGGGTVVFYYSDSVVRARQAQCLYNEVVSRTKLVGNRYYKVQKYSFYVLRRSNAPALLIENGFMDSTTDVPIILTEEHAERTAEGIAAFLISELKLEKKGGLRNEVVECVDAYKVEKHDTLIKIGQKLGIDWRELAAANNIVGPKYTIKTGQVLVLPKITPASNLYYPAYTGSIKTLAAALTAIGVDGSYTHRKKIAAANGINGYIGSANQNTQMYNLLVAGLLKRA